jgi:hypothetical protein
VECSGCVICVVETEWVSDLVWVMVCVICESVSVCDLCKCLCLRV